MIITYHGGGCCGIKHIKGMGSQGYKDKLWSAVAAPTRDFDSTLNLTYQNIYREAMPAETGLDRLKRYIAFYRVGSAYRGILEIVLATSPYEAHNQVLEWRDTLLELGFKEVSVCRNSNSMNHIHVFHLITDDK